MGASLDQSVTPPRKKIACRRMVAEDAAAAVALLREGFPDRPPGYWEDALAALGERAVPEGYPRYGFMLDCEGTTVGVILVIFSEVTEGDRAYIRCNVSSWYVQPAYRNYAAMLTSAALSFKEATYLNVSPAKGTWPILDAQGYRRYADGQMGCIPALGPLRPGVRVRAYDPAIDPELAGLIEQCARTERIALVCETGSERLPFVFLRRNIKHVGKGVAQLVYCRDTADFVRFSGPLGRRLMRMGIPLVLLDSEGPVPGLVGKFFNNRMPKYFKGPHRPRLNDLAHTEAVLFGV